MAETADPKARELIQTVSQISNGLMNEVAKVIIGKQENLRRITIGILSNGNTLIEDFPGLAKTLMANTFATALGCKFKRVQFTPDLLPADIMGTYMYDSRLVNSNSGPDLCLPTFYLLTRLTVLHPRLRRPCLRQWKRSRLQSRA